MKDRLESLRSAIACGQKQGDKYLWADLGLLAHLFARADEAERLKRGQFTEEELIDLAISDRRDPGLNLVDRLKNCSSKLSGLTRPDSEAERLLLRKFYDGHEASCCECGEDYPRADLVIDGEIYCPRHRGPGSPSL